jgi:hypothetical protein
VGWTSLAPAAPRRPAQQQQQQQLLQLQHQLHPSGLALRRRRRQARTSRARATSTAGSLVKGPSSSLVFSPPAAFFSLPAGAGRGRGEALFRRHQEAGCWGFGFREPSSSSSSSQAIATPAAVSASAAAAPLASVVAHPGPSRSHSSRRLRSAAGRCGRSGAAAWQPALTTGSTNLRDGCCMRRASRRSDWPCRSPGCRPVPLAYGGLPRLI